jgi:V8-like Glu-specific endopeptidase
MRLCWPTQPAEAPKGLVTLRRNVAVSLIAVAFLLVAAVAAEARPVLHKTSQARGKVVDYWTAARMRGAVPADRRLPNGKPSKSGGGGGTKASSASTEVPLPYPSAHGKVFFTDGGTNYVCSGTAISSVNESVVWTAGHCVNEGPGGFYTNFVFVPAYRDGKAPYGKFAASHLAATSGWEGSGEYGVDIGAAVVARNESGQRLSAAVDERVLVFDAPRVQGYQLYGYPAAKKFSGQRMRVCNTSWLMDDNSAIPATMGASCDMTGGSSGGGWVTSSGAVASVISYGYASLRNVLFGPHQEKEAQQLFATAEAVAAP